MKERVPREARAKIAGVRSERTRQAAQEVARLEREMKREEEARQRAEREAMSDGAGVLGGPA